jgi:hypothetical protein
VFGRQSAPVARLVGLLEPNQTAFVFNGVVPSLKGQPLVDDGLVVLFAGS